MIKCMLSVIAAVREGDYLKVKEAVGSSLFFQICRARCRGSYVDSLVDYQDVVLTKPFADCMEEELKEKKVNKEDKVSLVSTACDVLLKIFKKEIRPYTLFFKDQSQQYLNVVSNALDLNELSKYKGTDYNMLYRRLAEYRNDLVSYLSSSGVDTRSIGDVRTDVKKGIKKFIDNHVCAHHCS